ncbi:hypothetical protein EPUS_07844 [Endocarpon pusillum Z07020]|uniref:Uncharacterized protein n=1 Tax=Endocarpon pusillum (strain Z07020 / HMAS-L-300199) TaxID=1263415 RepID=U1HH04_ENDPU|nr:uncharacterized protein EPUS_07844 [Endocarpon pusillum Z07020]ERF69440.1 hypothetical protein EPUS_07844 [Endocarpon pusillum Z07020]
MVDQTTSVPPPTSSPSLPPSLDISALESDLQASRCAFTPPTLDRVPRPWERRPATPFAPRTETHKIWKRCERVAGQLSRSQAKTMNGHDERLRMVKRLRVDSLHSGDEERDGSCDEGFVGTKFEELDCEGEERRRKLANATPCKDLCVNEGKKQSRGILPTESNSRYSAARTTATFDGSASPTPPRRICSGGPTILADDDEPAAKGRELQEKQFIQETDQDSIPGKIQALHGCIGDTASFVAEKAKISLLADGEDTEYLHAFLTRARAKKAARNLPSSQRQVSKEKQKQTASSPQTRSRTVLATLDRNSPSPTKTRKLDTPGDRFEQDQTMLSDMKATSPVRKGGRARLPQPQPQWHQPATQSSFPFRRSNGTEFVFLQKTEAQQIAIATRSNTKRNKGDGMHPRKKLEALSSQQKPSPAKTARRKKNGKRVLWDEGLAYFAPGELQASDVPREQTEAETPVKRSRRLAPGRGTPAPKKKMADAAIDAATPLPPQPPPTRIRTRAMARA